MARVADTSFLYAAFDVADPRHQAARDEIAKPQALNIPLCVMAEFLDLVTYRHDHTTAVQVHRDLASLTTVALVPIRDEAKVVTLWAEHPGLSMADAAAVQMCMECKDTLVSYDAKQVKALKALQSK